MVAYGDMPNCNKPRRVPCWANRHQGKHQSRCRVFCPRVGMKSW
jgi:hypothetical protein